MKRSDFDVPGLVLYHGWHCSPDCIGETFCQCGECHRVSECSGCGADAPGPELAAALARRWDGTLYGERVA